MWMLLTVGEAGLGMLSLLGLDSRKPAAESALLLQSNFKFSFSFNNDDIGLGTPWLDCKKNMII